MANIPFLNNAYFAAKVGIGVPTPNESLEVSGSILLSSRLKLGTGDHYLQQTSGDIYSFTTGKNIMYAGSAEVFRVDEAKLATFKGDAYFNSGLITTIDSEGSFYIDVNANNAYGGRNFRVLNNGTTYLNINADGNVGIGTTSPAEKLHVSADVRVDGSGGVAVKKIRSSYFSSSQNLDLEAGSSADIILTSSNVGIGASSPDSKLNINGNSGDPSATYTTTAANSTISIGDFSASGLRMLFGVNPSTPSTWIQNQYTTNQVTAKLLLNPLGGNVGIGTTSPTEKLHIFGTTAAVKIEGDGVTSANLKFKTNETDRWNVNVPSGSTDLRFTTGSSDTLTLKSNGNVGIGTTAPSQKLHISGNMRLTGAFRDRLNSQGAANYVLTSTGSNGTQWVDASGSSIIGGPYLPLAGGTMTGNINLNDNVFIKFGNQPDFEIGHDASNSYISHTGVGNLIIQNTEDNADIIFKSDNGSGGVAEYFRLDGGATKTIANKNFAFVDSVKAEFGDSGDLQIYHEGTDSIIQNYNGSIYIDNNADNQDIIFRCDDGSGGIENYMQIDGSAGRTLFNKNIRVNDNVQVQIGNSADFHLSHNGTNSYLTNDTGDLYIRNNFQDRDIIFQSDDGNGGLATYFQMDGSQAASPYVYTRFPDYSVAAFGNGNNLQIYHTDTTGFISEYEGDLKIMNHADDKDIQLMSDDGSGGVTTYLRLDGSDAIMKAHKNLRFLDSVKANFGNSDDLQIYHNSSNDRGYIYNATGDLYIENDATDGDIKFYSDDGSGGTALYFRIDGGSIENQFIKSTLHFDNVKAKFGDDADLQIYHDGSNSYIKEIGTGNLWIQGSAQVNIGGANGEIGIQYVENANVTLRHNNVAKLATTSTGVTVTGNATFTGDITFGDSHFLGDDGNNNLLLQSSSGEAVIINGNTNVRLQDGGNTKLTTTSTGVTVTGAAATTFLGDLNGTINTATTAVTKANATNDTTVATTAFVQNLIGTIPAGLVFQGTWNASTNTPTLTSGSGTTGHFYIVSTDGSTNLDGITDWKVGDWAVFVEQGASDQWEKVDNSSVLDGSGTGQTVALWSGSGTSNTLTNAPITVSGNNSTFAGTVNIVGTNSTNQESVLLRGIAGSDLLGSIRTANTGGYNQEMRFYTSNASGSSDEDLTLTLHASQNATFAGSVSAVGLNLSSATGPIITLTDTDASIGVDSIIGHIAFVGTEIGGETSRIASVSETAGGEAGLRFYTGASVTQALQLDKDQNATFAGKILVGTGATAAASLNAYTQTVSSNLFSALRVIENSNASSYWDIGATGGSSTLLNFYHNGTTSPKISFTHTGGATFTGNVGIGTTAPSATEPIGGNLPTGWTRSGSRALEIAAPDFASSGLFLRNSGTTATGTDITGDQYFGDTYIDNRYNNDNGSIYFRTKTAVSPQIRMAIKGSGKVGIGTTTPSSKLQVAGGIQMANDTDTASAAKVGTMRYRTGTEYVEDTGIQLLLNNNFDTDTVWSKGTGWAISGGKANATASTDYLSQNPYNPVASAYYQITWTISNYSAGTYRFYMRGNVSADFGTSTYIGNGTFTHVMQAGGGGANGFLFDARSALTASIDDIILTAVSVEDASYADMCMQTGSSTYEWVNIVRNTY
jgi:hypothetical protein